MSTTSLRQALLQASVDQLGGVIDWIQRPWAPENNDALRGAWHEARRHSGARRALAYAIEQDIRTALADARGVHLLGQRLAVSPGAGEAVVAEITRRLGAAVGPEPSADVLVSALRAVVDVTRSLIGVPSGAARAGRRRHDRHRGYGHGS